MLFIRGESKSRWITLFKNSLKFKFFFKINKVSFARPLYKFLTLNQTRKSGKRYLIAKKYAKVSCKLPFKKEDKKTELFKDSDGTGNPNDEILCWKEI